MLLLQCMLLLNEQRLYRYLILHLSRHADRRGVKISILARFLTEVLEDGIFNSISDSSIIVSLNSDESESNSYYNNSNKNNLNL